MMNAPAFGVKRLVRPALLTIALYFSVIVISSMAMVKPAHASGSVHRTSALSWCSHENNPATCTYSTKEAACHALAATMPSYYNEFTHFYSGQEIAGWACLAYSLAHPGDGRWAQRLGWLVQGGACPSNSTSPNIHTSSCTCTDPYVPDPTATSCVSDQYTLTLTPTSATIEPGGTYLFTATVTNQDGSTPAQPVPVTVEVEVDLTSGGHGHGGSDRPKGSVSPASGNTALSITFAATEVSGTHIITATCNLCSNSPLKATVKVKVEGLTTIPSDQALYAFIGGESDKKHHDNHYLTQNAMNQLFVLAINYHFLYPNDPVLHLNDASLVWGGRFDIKGDWAGPHDGHRKGTVIDIRANPLLNPTTAIPESLFTDFIELAAGMTSSQAQLHHVGLPTQHFHVLLLGVDQ